MSLDAAWALGQDAMFAVMGLAITVTRPAPHDTPVETRGIWLTPQTESNPFGADLSRRDPRKTLAVPRSTTLSSATKGTLIEAAETDAGDVKTWRVEGYAQPVTIDEMRLLVVEV